MITVIIITTGGCNCDPEFAFLNPNKALHYWNPIQCCSIVHYYWRRGRRWRGYVSQPSLCTFATQQEKEEDGQKRVIVHLPRPVHTFYLQSTLARECRLHKILHKISQIILDGSNFVHRIKHKQFVLLYFGTTQIAFLHTCSYFCKLICAFSLLNLKTDNRIGGCNCEHVNTNLPAKL